jgi:hypothetical protein
MITTDAENATLDVPDLGITLRSLLAVAAAGYTVNPKRIWKVRYKNSIIGSIRIKVPAKK